MFIKMLKTQKGADDDDLNKVITFVEGETYEMGENLARVFIRERWGEKAKKPKGEEKEDGDSNENKEEEAPPENKKRGRK